MFQPTSQPVEAKTHPLLYSQLDDASVRLLTCRDDRPATRPGTPLEWELTTHSLSNSPPYVALSYAWNEIQASVATAAAPPDRINVNGQDIAVSTNLYYAIHHLVQRQTTESPRHFWVDAVCIDQSSVVERASQVSIMHRIYRQAALVFVWLGPDLLGEANTVREFFRAFLQRYYIEEDSDIHFAGNDADHPGPIRRKYATDFLCGDVEHNLAMAELPPLDATIWTQAIRFWDRSWFSRVWVQQEVAVARRVEFWCGGIAFQQMELAETSRFFGNSGLGKTLLEIKNERLESRVERQVGHGAAGIDDLQLWASGVEYLEADDFRQAAERFTGPAPPVNRGLRRLLRIFAVNLFLTFSQKASDPKDKVFALLILANQIADASTTPHLPLESDYSKSIETVYREATAWVIKESGWLGMFCLLNPLKNADRLEGPSWVPNFQVQPPACLRLFAPSMSSHIQDCYDMITPEGRPHLSADMMRIHVRGKRIGTVADVGDTFASMKDGEFELSSKMMLKCPKVVDASLRTRIDAWMDALTGRDPSLPPPDADERAAFKHWLSYTIVRRISNDFIAGRITRASTFLNERPYIQQLAESDETGTVPSYSYWEQIIPYQEKANAILEHRPAEFQTIEIAGRVLFRLTDLGFPHCPPAMLLGLGPEAIEVGDEVWTMIGSPMPVVLRALAKTSHHTDVDTVPGQHDQALSRQVVGEAYLSSISDIVNKMCDVEWQNAELH